MRQKKCLFVFSLIILLSAFLLAQSKNIEDTDGNEWINMQPFHKVGYIRGFIMGTSLMHERAIQRQFLPLKDTEEPKFQFLMELVNNEADKLLLYKITTGQLVDGVDALYSDFSTRKIKLIDAIYIIKMQINGADPDLLSAQIRYLKQLPTMNWETRTKLFDKVELFNGSVQRCFDAGKITVEELLYMGWFVNKDKKIIRLFFYGDY